MLIFQLLGFPLSSTLQRRTLTMAKEASLCLFCLSLLVICSSATLVGFSYRGRGDAATSTHVRTRSFLKQNEVSPFQIRMFVTDHRILSTLTNSDVPIDFYLNSSQIEHFISSQSSAVSWLRTHLIDLHPQVDIKSIIAICSSECLSQKEINFLLPALKSLHSGLIELQMANEVKVSVAFPLSSLEKLHKSRENDLTRVLSFLKEINSFVMIKDPIDDEFSMGDQFFQSISNRANIATSLLPCKDIPMVLTIKSPAFSSSRKAAQFSERASKYVEEDTQISGMMVAFYAEIKTIGDFELKREEEKVFPLSRREILGKFHIRRRLDDTTTPPTVVYPTPTNPTSATPLTTPADTPTIITVPSTIPVPPPPATPANLPPPVTNPTTTPITVPGAQPGASYPPPSGSIPVTNPVAPPANTNAPAVSGQSWCVAKTGVPDSALQSALDYACGAGGVDCSQIQQGGSCYNPNSVQNHASFAFNSYYQKNPGPTSCDFGGVAAIVNTNPSTGSCIYSSSSSSIPTSSASGASGYGTPPSLLNSSSPGSAPGFGSDSTVNTATMSHSAGLPLFVTIIILVIPLFAR